MHSAPHSLQDSLKFAFEGDVEPAMLEVLLALTRATERKMQLEGGTPHHVMIDVIATAIDFPDAERRALRAVLDLLQVTIDVTDDLADAESDRLAGRAVDPEIEQLSLPVLQCAPSILSMRAISLLYDFFPAPGYDARGAVAKLRQVLSRMALGQGLGDASTEKIERVSGDQGRILCLPFWLSPSRVSPAELAAIETWAHLYGVTWEMYWQVKERPQPAVRFALARSISAARRAWPRVSPFLEGEALAWTVLLPPAIG